MFRAKYRGRAIDGRAINPGDLIEGTNGRYRLVSPGADRYAAIERTVGRGAADEYDLDRMERAAFDAERQAEEDQYQQGLADGRRYQAEKKVYGQALADAFAAQDDWNRYWKYGED